MKEYIEHFKGAQELATRLMDQIQMSQRQNRVIFTPFLSVGEGNVLTSLCGKEHPYKCNGGFVDAQRCCYALLPYEEIDVEFPIVLLKAKYRSRFENLTHRDVLGAFLNQGIEREKIGDILIQDDAVYIAVMESISTFLIGQITKIKHTTLSFVPYNGIVQYEQAYELHQYNVSSLRMDAIVSGICHLSRSKAASLISSGLVKVNDLPLETSSALCHNNSTVSIRGYGRFQFIEVKHMTKKNRFVIEVRVFC